MDTSTKYVHIKSTTVYGPRRNWDSPNPFLTSECSPPPRNRGRGHTSLRVGGWGESQFRRGAYTVVLFICSYFVNTSIYKKCPQIKCNKKNLYNFVRNWRGFCPVPDLISDKQKMKNLLNLNFKKGERENKWKKECVVWPETMTSSAQLPIQVTM